MTKYVDDRVLTVEDRGQAKGGAMIDVAKRLSDADLAMVDRMVREELAADPDWAEGWLDRWIASWGYPPADRVAGSE